MAVYKRSYRGYTGALTARWSRFLILRRYAAAGMFKSRIITGLFVICFFYPAAMAVCLYLNHNARVLSLLKLHSDHIISVNGAFFMIFMHVQASLAFLMTVLIGPNSIAPDLSYNALPLYFCRPLSRAEYVLGRASAMFGVLSWITWIPALFLFAIETSLSGTAWGWQNLSYAFGILVGSLMWIVFLTLLALALSAWVRWRIVAGGLLLGVMFLTSGFSAALNEVLRTKTGFYMSPAVLVESIWAGLFDVDMNTGVTALGGFLGLAVLCGLCILMLNRKVKAFEVVR